MTIKDWREGYCPEYRLTHRKAFCRACDGVIESGEMMVTMYSRRNTGQHIHFHPECVKQMAALIDEVHPE